MTCGDDDESPCTHTHRTTDRTTNLLIFSNVHYFRLGGNKNKKNRLPKIYQTVR